MSAKAIETPMKDYVKEHNTLRYIFFGGKGGVGKTVMAGATAICLPNRASASCWLPRILYIA